MWNYKKIYKPGYHRSHKSGRVYEHVLVAEKILGKPLPKNAVVHHIDGNGLNNNKNNLVICENDTYHKMLHRRRKAFLACGSASWLPCCYCGMYDSVENLYINPRGSQRHIECHKKYMAKYNKEKRAKDNYKGV